MRTKPGSIRSAVPLLPLLIVSAATCTDTTAPGGSSLHIQGTVSESWVEGPTIPDTRPVAGIQVLFEVLTPDGAGAWASDSTDADGIYSLRVEVPGGCGGRDSVNAVQRIQDRDFATWERGSLGGGFEVGCTSDPQTLDATVERTDFRTPQPVAGNLTATAITAGDQYVCATAADGIYCWGVPFGSPGFIVRPVVRQDATGLVHLDANSRLVCGLDGGGAAHCWGDNGYGQVGVSDPSVVWGSGAQTVDTDLRFVQIATGTYHACGLTADGAVYCWGNGGTLGTGVTMDPFHPTLERVASGRTFVQIAAGKAFTCGLDDTGSVWCWGSNSDGQLGNGVIASPYWEPSVQAVGGGHTFASIVAGGFHACGLTASGEAWCWGRNGDGQLGDGEDGASGDQSTPVHVRGGHTFTSLTAGGFDTCGLTADGAAWCWGADDHGELGIEKTDSCTGGFVGDCVKEPGPVSGGLTFAMLSAGWAVTCGITPAGKPYCWGAAGALGIHAY